MPRTAQMDHYHCGLGIDHGVFASRSLVASLTLDISYQQVILGVTAEIVYWSVWAPLTPLIFGFAARYPPNREKWLSRLALILLFGTLVVILQIALDVSINLAIVPRLFSISAAETAERLARTGGLKRLVLVSSFPSFLTYLLIIGGYYASDYYKKYRERDFRAKELERMLAQAELQNLKMQLHPHFLFNTLHSISILINEDAEAANRMLLRLSELLRASLEKRGAQEVPLKEELEFLEGYLEIEQTRFQERLRVKIDVAPDVLAAHVPSLILQPLVENAVRHGIAPLLASGTIEITGRRENKMLRLEIKDNGPGIAEDEAAMRTSGIGLSATRARLAQFYGDNYQFEIRPRKEGGTLASLTIPFKEEAEVR